MVDEQTERLYLIDGSAPFFTPFVDGRRKNWSKAPLEQLLKHGTIPTHISDGISRQMKIYLKKIQALGYTAITFDDLAHITMFDFYPYALSRSIRSYQEHFEELFALTKREGLDIYITTDLLFWNEYIEKEVGNSDVKMRALFTESLERLFDLYPEVSGVVLRIGESDGVDVTCSFKSRMVIKSPAQCNKWLHHVVPLFEEREKSLIFRTWGLGAFSVGDLIWNKQTEKRAFRNISSNALILSRKYGEADFFRYLQLNPLFLQSEHKQIIEFQARREYEGFGEFPAYCGPLYQKLYKDLQDAPHLCGFSIWAQTGGWSHFDKLTFLHNSSPWNELNVATTIAIFKDGASAASAVETFVQNRFPQVDADTVLRYVDLCQQLIENIWYYPPYATEEFWFRRLRFPPLLWIFWDTILVNRAIGMFFQFLTSDRKEQREKDKQFRRNLSELEELAKVIALPPEEYELTMETFKLLIAIRAFYLGKGKKKARKKLKLKIEKYRKRFPQGFKVEADFAPFRLRWITVGFICSLLLRKHARYRWLDRLLLVPLLGWIFPLFKRWQQHRFPAIARKQAIGIELFFR